MKQKPANELVRRERIYVTLDPDAIRIARKLGNGVVSRGIDRALFAFKPTKEKVHASIQSNPAD